MTIRLTTRFEAPPEAVWDEVRRIERHVEWMSDALAIDFTSSQREGVGTSFRCTTRVGPFTLEDAMTVTRWREGSALGVRHEGLVTGEGLFEQRADGAGGTALAWTEDVRFPVRLLGPVGAWIARPLLRRIWRGNLQRLGALVDGPR